MYERTHSFLHIQIWSTRTICAVTCRPAGLVMIFMEPGAYFDPHDAGHRPYIPDVSISKIDAGYKLSISVLGSLFSDKHSTMINFVAIPMTNILECQQSVIFFTYNVSIGAYICSFLEHSLDVVCCMCCPKVALMML